MSFQTKLLRWFSKNARPLPWRRHYRPYEVWVSEIMLQQTQMDTMLPYFERWMKAFPDVETLACADESKVLKLWQGLGYYSRARNLHAAAKEIAQKHGGQFPSDHKAVRSLKGVGRYTAGAISSIAFNEPRPIVDGNVLRVLARVKAIARSIDDPAVREEFWKLQESLIPKGRARDFNQALMELGALVCTPKNPSCGICPIRSKCRAFEQGDPERYPARRPRKKTVRVTAAALALQKSGSYLLMRRPVGKIMGGLWEFPEWKLTDCDASEPKIKKLAELSLGLSVSKMEKIGTIKRNYTHHLETLHVFTAETFKNGVRLEPGWQAKWAAPNNFIRHAFSSAHAKIAGLLSGLPQKRSRSRVAAAGVRGERAPSARGVDSRRPEPAMRLHFEELI